MTGLITVTYRHDGSHPIAIIRNGDVGPAFWLALQAHWDHASLRPARELNITLEDLVREQSWFGKQLRRYNVSATVTPAVQHFLIRHRDIKSDLRNIQTELEDSSELNFLSDSRSRFSGGLTSFQLRDVSKLLAIRNGANLSVPGAGKTASCLAIYETERLRGARRRATGDLSDFGFRGLARGIAEVVAASTRGCTRCRRGF